jgi:hypothetical protein
MAGKRAKPAAARQQEPLVPTLEELPSTRKRWTKLTPRDHVLKQIEVQRGLVENLRKQLHTEEQTLQGMEKAKEFFPD